MTENDNQANYFSKSFDYHEQKMQHILRVKVSKIRDSPLYKIINFRDNKDMKTHDDFALIKNFIVMMPKLM